MDHVPGVLCHPRHPSSLVTFPIWTYHRDRDFHPRTYRGPAPLYFLIFEQNRRTEYHEVLIAGDLSQEDVREAIAQLMTTGSYGGGTSDTVELVYNNETVYFAQPSLSQFVPGGSGLGTFTPAPIVLRVQPNNNPATSRNAPKSDTGAVLRYALPGL